jgi:hypothetical protein
LTAPAAARLNQHQQRREISALGTLEISSPSPNITRVSFNNGPVNFVDRRMITDLLTFIKSLQNVTDTTPKVVIFDSVNPNFYMGHIDMTTLQVPITAADKQLYGYAFIAKPLTTLLRLTIS